MLLSLCAPYGGLASRQKCCRPIVGGSELSCACACTHTHTHTHTHTVNTRPHTRKHTRAEAGGHAEGGGQVCKCRFEPFPGQVARLLAGRVVLVRVDLSVNVKVMLGKVTWLYIPLGGI